MKRIVEPDEEFSFHDKVDPVEFHCLGSRLNASNGSEAAVTATTIGWIKFRECGKLLHEENFQ